MCVAETRRLAVTDCEVCPDSKALVQLIIDSFPAVLHRKRQGELNLFCYGGGADEEGASLPRLEAAWSVRTCSGHVLCHMRLH